MEVLLVAVKRDKVNDYVSVISQTGQDPGAGRRRRLRRAERLRGQLRPRPAQGRGAGQHGRRGHQHQHPGPRPDRLLARHLLRRQPVHRGAAARVQPLFDQAEALKRGERWTATPPADARPVLDTVSARDGVARSARPSTSSPPPRREGPVDELVLSGGCALTPNLLQVLRERFEVPTELMDPLRRIQYKRERLRRRVAAVDRADDGGGRGARASARWGTEPMIKINLLAEGKRPPAVRSARLRAFTSRGRTSRSGCVIAAFCWPARLGGFWCT